MATATRWRRELTAGPRSVAASSRSPGSFPPFTAILEGTGGASLRPPMPEARRDKARFVAQIGPYIARSVRGIYRSSKTLADNPRYPRRELSAALLQVLERKATAWGADLIGYTKLDPDLLFRGRRVVDANVIVLAMEMAEEPMMKSPHFDSELEVQRVYADLGDVALRVAEWLRAHGYAAQAGPALGGDSVYPALACQAGLGEMGHSGLLITEAFGPRVRLAVVYCSVDNLPFPDPTHARPTWIAEFCDMCGACLRKCPPQALLSAPRLRENGAPTYVDNDKCFPYFEKHYGCAACIACCPFSHTDVGHLKAAWEKRQPTVTAAA